MRIYKIKIWSILISCIANLAAINTAYSLEIAQATYTDFLNHEDVSDSNEGTYAFKPVLDSQPVNHAARLELARGYFILQEYSRSRTEFNTALEYNPPEVIRKRIYNYLDSIRRQEAKYITTSTAYIELGYGADSNINSSPSNARITFLGETGLLNNSTLEQEDNYTKIKAHYDINTPLTAKISFNAGIKASLNNNNEHTELNTSTSTKSAGFRFLHAQDAYFIDLISQQFSIDGEDYRQLTGINSSWNRNLSLLSTAQAFFQFSKQEFFQQKIHNVDTSTLGIGFSKRFKASLSPVLFSSIYIAQDKPEDDSDIAKQIAERDYYGARIGTVLRASKKTTSQLSFNYQNSQYGLEDINGTLRQDKFTSTDLNLTWSMSKNWQLLVNASIVQNDSNKNINTYDREKFGISLRYEMK